MQLKIKKLTDTAVIPSKAHNDDACYDLSADEDIYLFPQHQHAVSTGLKFDIPDGYLVSIRPRSGISLKTPIRVANTPGTVDSNYKGEIKVILHNTAQLIDDATNNVYYDLTGHAYRMSRGEMRQRKIQTLPWGTIKISKGDRIAQFLVEQMIDTELVETDDVGESDRGETGFGDSGV